MLFGMCMRTPINGTWRTAARNLKRTSGKALSNMIHSSTAFYTKAMPYNHFINSDFEGELIPKESKWVSDKDK
jgi:hypothetical protein